jgi:hypothetical protein
VIGHIGGEVSARRGRGDKQHGGAGRHGPASAPRRAQRFRAERGACWGDARIRKAASRNLHRARCRGVLGLLVIEWSRLFHLRPAPGQHGAVITVGSKSSLLADAGGPLTSRTLAGGEIGVAMRVTSGPNPWRVAGRWLRARELISEGGVGR